MSDDDLKQEEVIQESTKISEAEILPPVLRVVPQTRDHQKDEQLGLQIRDLAKHGLSKSSVALTARVSVYIFLKYKH